MAGNGEASRAFWTWYRIQIQPKLSVHPPEGSAVLALQAAEKQLGPDHKDVIRFKALYGKLVAAGIARWMN